MDIDKIERGIELAELKRKCSKIQPGEELDITNERDRAMEANILSWLYRQKRKGIFFRKETRGPKVFVIRDK
jgi:TusA-related sulfurtransferase